MRARAEAEKEASEADSPSSSGDPADSDEARDAVGPPPAVNSAAEFQRALQMAQGQELHLSSSLDLSCLGFDATSPQALESHCRSLLDAGASVYEVAEHRRLLLGGEASTPTAPRRHSRYLFCFACGR